MSRIISSKSEREKLLTECQLHAPPHLQKYVLKAFALLDVEVQSGRRSYSQVVPENVLTVASKLFQHEANSINAPVSHVQPAIKRARSPVLLNERNPIEASANFSIPSLLCGLPLRASSDKTGKSVQLERNYSRDEPTMDMIRPLEVLKRAFAHVKKRAMELGTQYLYDQLKGMRQDLLVQNIRNSFAVLVYETHARTCLEMKNLSEFNLCQSALRSFYSDGLVGEEGDCYNEFLCYRLLYLVLGEKDDLFAIELKELEQSVREGSQNAGRIAAAFKSETVLLVLRFCACIQQGDSMRAIKIARNFTFGTLQLLKIFLQRQRIRWLRDLGSSVRGSIPLSFVMSMLGFAPFCAQHITTLQRSCPAQFEPGSVKNVRELDSRFFIDGSAEEAAKEWFELMKLLKVVMPEGFSFREELLAIDDPGRHVLASLDSSIFFRAVGEYCSFLTTRTDIATE